MTNRRILVTVLALCALATAAEANIPICPDKKNCFPTNGTGVYYAENGAAGVWQGGFSVPLLVTHFVNGAGGVQFGGDYLDSDGVWKFFTRAHTSVTANYEGQNWNVVSIHETGTLPTIALHNSTGDVSLTGDDLTGVSLHLYLPNPVADTRVAVLVFTLYFNGPSVAIGIAPGDGGQVEETGFHIAWTSPQTPGVLHPYCLTGDSPRKPDTLVFQEGIYVNPSSGDASSQPTYVTISCSQGALAKAAWWGYSYQTVSNNGDLPYFKAAIHMKRASYCGDSHFATEAGTPIYIEDEATIQPAPGTSQGSTTLEAYWGVNGALCANHPRHLNMPVDRSCPATASSPARNIPTCENFSPSPTRWLRNFSEPGVP